MILISKLVTASVKNYCMKILSSLEDKDIANKRAITRMNKLGKYLINLVQDMLTLILYILKVIRHSYQDS